MNPACPRSEDDTSLIDQVANGLAGLLQIAERIHDFQDCVGALEEGLQHSGRRRRAGGLGHGQPKPRNESEHAGSPGSHTLKG